MNVTFARFHMGLIIAVFLASGARADQLELQNGDRLSGKVLSMSADTVLLESQLLGKVKVPRSSVISLVIGTNQPSSKETPTAQPVGRMIPSVGVPPASLQPTNAELFASPVSPGADTNVIRQIREQMLGGNPAAAAKFDELAGGLMSGKLTLDDLRREARTAAGQLRELKRDFPDAAESLDAYLGVLETFLNEPDNKPSAATSSPRATKQGQ